jgi:MoxR-like ATPase
MARISMGYPSPQSELEMLDLHSAASPLEDLEPVTDAATVSAMIAAVRRVHASPAVKQYVVDLAQATRTSAALRLGASPRATIHLLRAARAHAALLGRDHVLPDDVQSVSVPVLAHRLILTGETQMARRTAADVVTDLVQRVRVPAPTR